MIDSFALLIVTCAWIIYIFLIIYLFIYCVFLSFLQIRICVVRVVDVTVTHIRL